MFTWPFGFILFALTPFIQVVKVLGRCVQAYKRVNCCLFLQSACTLVTDLVVPHLGTQGRSNWKKRSLTFGDLHCNGNPD